MSVRKNSSVIWHHFEKDNQTYKATCNECKDILSFKSSTANLKSQRRKHPSFYLSVFGTDDKSGYSTQTDHQFQLQVEPTPGTSSNSVVSQPLLAPPT